ncbi:MAG TPA: hypothetical protein VF575_00930 [Candidatus Saccharimonadales bacterium]
MLDKDIPLDSIVLVFEEPTLMAASICGDTLPLERLRVPIMAINSCLDLPRFD